LRFALPGGNSLVAGFFEWSVTCECITQGYSGHLIERNSLTSQDINYNTI